MTSTSRPRTCPPPTDAVRQILDNPAIPARDRVRLACALGALMSGVYSSRSFEGLGPAAYGDLLREAISDLLG